MKKKNPFTLSFGMEPGETLPRLTLENEILETFTDDEPSNRVYMISGVRGSGKTVFMTEISEKLSNLENWIVVELNPEKDLLKTLAAKLSSMSLVSRIIKNAKINLSFLGLGLEIDGIAPITDIEIALEEILKNLGKHGKRVLVTIDEVTNNQNIKVFTSSFQIFIRKKLPLYLIMTGLYENIDDLQNEKSLTFLYRAPKLTLTSLNPGAVSRSYQRIFEITSEDARNMAAITKGYAFAFQLLGYFRWENNGNFDEAVMDKFRQYLDEYVYEKIWMEMSHMDRRLSYGIAKIRTGKILEIRQLLNLSTNEFNPYRKRLLRKGIIDGTQRGYVHFTLPCFEDFVIENYFEE